MERIIIDTDPGIDDTFAILLALQSPEIKVEGITTVEGNGHIENVTKNALRILEMAGRQDVKVYKGSSIKNKDFSEVEEIHGIDAFGGVFKDFEPQCSCEAEHAVDFIIRKVSENPGEITLATLGPLVNIAAAVKKAPEAMKQVRKIVIMGGAVNGGNVSPVAEANFFNAPDAADIVMTSAIPEKVMVGLDATCKLLLSSNVREILHQIKNKIANALYDITQVYVDFYWKTVRITGFTPHDTLVILYLINPALAETRRGKVRVVEEGLAKGQSVVDFNAADKDAEVCLDVDRTACIRKLLETMFPGNLEEINEALLNNVY